MKIPRATATTFEGLTLSAAILLAASIFFHFFPFYSAKFLCARFVRFQDENKSAMKAKMHLSLSFRITNRIKRNLHLPLYSYMVSTQTLSLCQKKEPSQCFFIHFRLLYVKRIWRLGGFVHNFIQSTPEHIISGRERDFV